jgi:hypothetical protein
MQEASGLQVGDKVRVLRKAKSYEMGWCYAWSEDMNAYIDKTFYIAKILSNIGITFQNAQSYCFPFFVLEKINAVD